MNADDLYKVWEIKKTHKWRLPREEEARKFLEDIARAVQPIMRKHKWSVKLLSEFWRYLGMNYGSGAHVTLRLRRLNWNDEWDQWNFLSFDEVMDTMLHELCHNVHRRHDTAFHNLWNELRKEYAQLRPKVPGFENRFDLSGNTGFWKQDFDELMAKGISGFGNWFDLPGWPLGGFSPQPPLSAAEKWSQVGSLLPSGPRPKRLGGDIVKMEALSPAQAAAIAAERRLQDNMWCGCEHSDNEDVNYESAENIVHKKKSVGISRLTDNSTLPWDQVSRKRSRSKDSSLSVHSSSNSIFIDLTGDEQKVGSITQHQTGSQHRSFRLESISNSQSNSKAGSSSAAMWECPMCTLLNKTCASICELCDTQQPKHVTTKYNTWSCKFCTLDNSVKMEKCSACDQWRYSHDPPMST